MLTEEYQFGKLNDLERYLAFEQKNRLEQLLSETKTELEYSKQNNSFGFIENTESKSDIELFIEMFIIKFNSEETNIAFDLPQEEFINEIHRKKKNIYDPFNSQNK